MTTYALDVFNLFDADESDPNPYFHSTHDNVDDMINRFVESWYEDHGEQTTFKFREIDELNPCVSIYDVYAGAEDVAVAYVRTLP